MDSMDIHGIPRHIHDTNCVYDIHALINTNMLRSSSQGFPRWVPILPWRSFTKLVQLRRRRNSLRSSGHSIDLCPRSNPLPNPNHNPNPINKIKIKRRASSIRNSTPNIQIME